MIGAASCSLDLEAAFVFYFFQCGSSIGTYKFIDYLRQKFLIRWRARTEKSTVSGSPGPIFWAVQ